MTPASLAAAGPRTFAFLLVPGLSMMSLSSAVEPLRSLNRLVGGDVYRWMFVSLDGGPVEASNGVAFATVPHQRALEEADVFIVCCGLRSRDVDEKRYYPVLRQAARRRIALGSLSTGTYLLARAGLLSGYRCTIHWENRSAFREDFPDVECTNKIYEIDRDRLTCSGGTAAMDMMLHLIGDRHGAEMARGVANQFHHERIRGDCDEQRGGRLGMLAPLPAKVREAIALMETFIENPLPLPEIGRRVQLSPRQLERQFQRHAGMSPLRFYIQLRLERARELLIYSDRQVIDVAVSVGFASTSHFAAWYKRIYGARPIELRGGGGLPARRPAVANRKEHVGNLTQAK
jgi:AraC family transcriptional regulator, glycine betaine-responsive activator